VKVVQSALVGSILANSLLVLGLAFFFGGRKNGTQKFHSETPRAMVILMVLAVSALVMPTLAHTLHTPASAHEIPLSIAGAIVLLILFFASIPFSLQGGPMAEAVPQAEQEEKRWSLTRVISTLVIAGASAAFVSDWFVQALEPAIELLGISEAFAGLVIVAIAVPLALLRPLGDGSPTPGDEPGNWVTVGTLAGIRDRGVVYDVETTAFVLAIGDDAPYALSAGTAHPLVVGDGLSPRALYCESDRTFVDPDGDVFDQHGAYRSGPVRRGLGRFPVRVTDGIVQIDTSEVTSSGSSDEQRTTAKPGCLTTNGIPFEGRPITKKKRSVFGGKVSGSRRGSRRL
jgi:hypothetical protein